MINKYVFGLIVIDEQQYNYDVEVYSASLNSGVKNKVLKWERETSHLIKPEDVERAVRQKPDIIIIGTGESGVACISIEAQEYILKQDIKLVIDKTEQAVKTFNIIDQDSLEEEGEKKKVVGLFHLTC